MNVLLSGHAVARTTGKPCDDAWAVRERPGTVVAALADGIGSSREGGTAARRAVEMLTDYALARPRAWSPRRALAEFSAQINRHLHSESLHRHGQPELTCTLCAVLVEGGRLYGCNVGDSPVFHWRRGRLQQLSESHSRAEPELGHVLTRALGLDAGVEPHFFETDAADGDLVLLCSDGVSNALPPDRLAELLARRATARTVVSTACSLMDDRPELRDDASAVVVEVVEAGGPAAAARQRLEVVTVLRPGEPIDEYKLVRPLIKEGRVWLAEDRQGTRVVLKFPPLEAADTEMVRDAFVREAWNASRLSSPDLVKAWTPDSPTLRYYAMDFIDAPTLRTVLRSAPLAVEEARELGQFLLRVGQFLLRHDLVHGDIKPENILVARAAGGTTFRLLDLGTAAELFSVTSRAGTPSYLAPERFQGAAVSEQTEVFAIAVTLYEALARTYPFGEVERFQTPRFDASPRRLSRINAAIPGWFESVVHRGLEPDPARRYQNFSEMSFDLANPDKVTAHHRREASLLERNPLLFYKLLSAALLALNVWLLWRMSRG